MLRLGTEHGSIGLHLEVAHVERAVDGCNVTLVPATSVALNLVVRLRGAAGECGAGVRLRAVVDGVEAPCGTAQRVQQCVSQRGRWCAVAGHSRRPAWCTLHCHSSDDSIERWRQWCSPAVLRSAVAAQRPAVVANKCRGGCLLTAEEALLHAPPHEMAPRHGRSSGTQQRYGCLV